LDLAKAQLGIQVNIILRNIEDNNRAKITNLINDCKSQVRKQRKRPTDNAGRLSNQM
jgi:hypothetical protein